MKSIVRSIAAATLVAAAAFVAQDAAADSKVLPGIACHDRTLDLGTPSWSVSGRIQNTSTTEALPVVCPLPRDSTLNPLDSASVWVLDMNYDDDVSCRIHMRSPNGTAEYVSATKYSSGTNSAGNELTFGTLSGYDYGALFLECSIPAKYSGNLSGINSIRFTEN